MGMWARVVVGLILVSLPAAALADSASEATFPAGVRLVLIPAGAADTPAALAASGVPVYARLAGPRGEWLLAGIDDAGLAVITGFGLTADTVDPAPAGGTFFRVARRPGCPDLDFAAFGRVVWTAAPSW